MFLVGPQITHATENVLSKYRRLNGSFETDARSLFIWEVAVGIRATHGRYYGSMAGKEEEEEGEDKKEALPVGKQGFMCGVKGSTIKWPTSGFEPSVPHPRHGLAGLSCLHRRETSSGNVGIGRARRTR